jgi:hypothetical protein
MRFGNDASFSGQAGSAEVDERPLAAKKRSQREVWPRDARRFAVCR